MRVSMVKVSQIPVGPMQNFAYLLKDESSGEAMAIDSGWETQPIVKVAVVSLKIAPPSASPPLPPWGLPPIALLPSPPRPPTAPLPLRVQPLSVSTPLLPIPPPEPLPVPPGLLARQ